MGVHRPLSAAAALVTGALAATALALALTGCTPTKPTPGFVEVTPGLSASASPTADAETVAADPAQPSTWTIGFDGVGPLVLGTPSTEQHDVLAAFEPEVAADGCGLDFVSTPPASASEPPNPPPTASPPSSSTSTSPPRRAPAPAPRTASGSAPPSTTS
ncbi:hypothetical protein [Leifsonia sp. WHRI 6310E]|uniref:hypothetical protein n=1 Tax=Leifsonia sp. WHRI 6310E TaxID=3162562 RepID=UPI0032EB4C10